jgi:DNA-binding Lrp family transcriptional regulator
MVYGYILVTLKSGAERDVCEKVANFEEVVQVDELYGEYDAIAKVQVKDLADLDKFLTDDNNDRRKRIQKRISNLTKQKPAIFWLSLKQ